jgi:gas vesicle protein
MNNEFDYASGSQGRFLAGVICGAAVGAALGVMFAPRAGAETRRQLAESSGRLRETANRTYNQASEGVSQIVSRGREAVDKGRAAFDRTRDKATSAASETYTETFGNTPYPTA